MAHQHRRSSSLGLTAWLWVIVALTVVLFDQFTKVLILGAYQLGEGTLVTSFFNVVRAHNTGAAFSLLAGASGWQRWFFTGIAALVSIGLLWLLRKHHAQRLFCSALSLILGGALGNLIDRLWHGHVIDFLDFHWAGYHFPAFNVADAAISLGAALLVLDELRRVRKGR